MIYMPEQGLQEPGISRYPMQQRFRWTAVMPLVLLDTSRYDVNRFVSESTSYPVALFWQI
jgi:hypothetical protein